MSGIKAGFSLIELMVVVAIIGIMTAVVIPRLGAKNPRKERENFVAELNALARFTVLEARATRMIHRLVIDIDRQAIQMQRQLQEKDSRGEPQYGPPKRSSAFGMVRIPRGYELTHITIEGFDEMGRFAGGSTKTTWFYIVPAGFSQAVVMTILDHSDTSSSPKGREFSLVLNPLTVQFREQHAVS